MDANGTKTTVADLRKLHPETLIPLNEGCEVLGIGRTGMTARILAGDVEATKIGRYVKLKAGSIIEVVDAGQREIQERREIYAAEQAAAA